MYHPLRGFLSKGNSFLSNYLPPIDSAMYSERERSEIDCISIKFLDAINMCERFVYNDLM